MFIYRTFSDGCIVKTIKRGVGYGIKVTHDNVGIVMIKVILDSVFNKIYGEFFLSIVMWDIYL